MQDAAPVPVETDHQSLWTYVACPTLVVDQTGIHPGVECVGAVATTRGRAPGNPAGDRRRTGSRPYISGSSHRHRPRTIRSRSMRRAPSPAASSTPTTQCFPAARWHGRSSRTPVRCCARPNTHSTREHERAEFLLEASSVLMASLNIDRCREATVQLAARDLADAAVVVAPASRGRRMPIFYGDSTGAVEQRSVDSDPTSVAGLSEALRGFPPVPSRWIDAATLPDWLIPSGFPAGGFGDDHPAARSRRVGRCVGAAAARRGGRVQRRRRGTGAVVRRRGPVRRCRPPDCMPSKPRSPAR